jgi:predicted DNA-binding protein (UPF0251 family)
MPVATFYKPRGMALHGMKTSVLPVEGFEAIRLVDSEGIPRREAARMMHVSPATLCRILQEARTVIARALANGWALKIEGGDYRVVEEGFSGTGRRGRPGGHGCGRGHGRTRGNRKKSQSCSSRVEKRGMEKETEVQQTKKKNMEVKPCQDKMEGVRKETDQ